MTVSALNSRRRSLCLALPALMALTLSACKEQEPAQPAPRSGEREFGIPSSQPVNLQALKRHGKGLTVGQQLSANEVFVFFDPKCPHCATFWLDSEKLREKVKFTWLPVALMGPGSAGAGAELLAAPDKVQAMTAHAAQVMIAMRAGQRSPVTNRDSGDPKLLADIARNSRLLTSFGASSVPYVVAVNSQGAVVLSGSGVAANKLYSALDVSQEP